MCPFFINLLLLIYLPFCYPQTPKCTSISVPELSPTAVEENNQLNRQINRNVKLWQLNILPTMPKQAQHTTNRSLAVLDLTIQVVKSACPNRFIPHKDVIDGVLDIFTLLHENSGDIRYFEDPVKPFMFSRIAAGLISCQKRVLPEGHYFSAGQHDHCPSPASTINQICHRNYDYDLDVIKCQKLKLRHERRKNSECFQNTNLIIDVVWSIVEIVHAVCFKEFREREDFSAFHMWEQALEGLFTRKIRKYWYEAPLEIEEYQTILHPNIRQHIFNLEMCLKGINKVSKEKIPRLQRPTYPLMMYGKRRKKRRSSSASNNYNNNNNNNNSST